ncbi:peptide chain release factor N(5)-glutamine methyltransferase [Methylobacterium iners]|uniref:Release factor glutamine methyltransferase n=1 Tax=Methylobacterium iners TaxID=418707 RepID=A0ABQ4RSD6_9HYPH|nr:peptide chain release factor N(5)-glutamine methyltransferase [Methylobacterium iners]GJD93698.1 Release factor glutamine methyltransferase [Methylobacterium iners]
MTLLDPTLSRRAGLAAITKTLTAAGIDPAGSDARFLILGVLGLTPTDLALGGDESLGSEGAARLRSAVARRLAGEPVARILGAWEFWGLPFELSPATLVPRPDTETLVEAALARCPERSRPLRLLDLGTGSGCILIALLAELPNAFGIGLDRSLDALLTARANAVANGVGERAAFLNGDWGAAIQGAFDLVVANPPYIAREVIAGLATEVREHDPVAALDGGEDGLAAYRSILAEVGAGGGIAPGALLFEVGHDQAGAVSALGRAAGFGAAEIVSDLAGHDRVVALTPKPRS